MVSETCYPLVLSYSFLKLQCFPTQLLLILSGTSVVLVTVENWNAYRKGHSEIFTLTDHRVTKNSLLNMANLCSLLNRQLQNMAVLCTRLRVILILNTLLLGVKKKKIDKIR